MYSDITDMFLNSIKSLRFYVNSVEKNIGNSYYEKIFNEDDLLNNGKKIFALFMYLVIEAKKEGVDLLDDLQVAEEISKEEIEQFAKVVLETENLIREKEIDGKKVYQYKNIPKELKEEYQKLEIEEKQEEILYSGSLMLLITYFENMIAGVIKKDFIKHPERVSLKEKTVSYKLLTEVGNIDDIRDILIDQEVTNMMYDSLNGWKKFFQKSLKLELRSWEEKFDILQEIIARRNLFVHNNGVINNTYLNKLNSSDRNKIGKYIGIDRKYIDNAINIIEYIGISLIIEVWVKEYADDENEMKSIISIIYEEYLESERWEMAKQLYEICMNNKKICAGDKILCQINYWQCYKWQGKYDEIKKEVENVDLSAYRPMYILGILTLKEDYQKFFEIFDEQSDIGEAQLKEWPLFRELRKSEEYMIRFPDIEPYEMEWKVDE